MPALSLSMEWRGVIWYESDNPNGFVTGKRFSVDAPCVTMMAAGMGGDFRGYWHLWTDGRTDGRTEDDPS